MKGKLPVHDIRHSYFLQVLFVFYYYTRVGCFCYMWWLFRFHLLVDCLHSLSFFSMCSLLIFTCIVLFTRVPLG